MKHNVYESAVMINAALDDDQIEQIISRIRESIVNNGGEIREVEKWGRKRLAYVVKKSKIGYYVFFRFNSPSNIISKLERSYSLDEQILRYLTIKLDSDAVEYLEKNKITPIIEEPDIPSTKEIDTPVVEEIDERSEESDT